MAFPGFPLVLQQFRTIYSLDEFIHSLVFNNRCILMTPNYVVVTRTLYWTYWTVYFNCFLYISTWMNFPVNMTFCSINLNPFSVSWNGTSGRILGIILRSLFYVTFCPISYQILSSLFSKYDSLYMLVSLLLPWLSLGAHNFFLDFCFSTPTTEPITTVSHYPQTVHYSASKITFLKQL